MARNRAIRDEVAAKRITRAPAGLDRHLVTTGSLGNPGTRAS
jgi:hypothetical protein